ncbi:hypothetical protein HELRODRAFT_168144 [Helobdella robusta]|uniref:Tyrosinase copper-binding domain-containing protein n=1 Tax=Helobdella robusta TaxID=6412 RepID=T1F079_HELRO|nr:hypothetical protein HELRODRAFT_168144 [Helobdella robusta]ESO10253.1 hypothetical protein HELRODRAFT_168144 [Helobdella robusta]
MFKRNEYLCVDDSQRMCVHNAMSLMKKKKVGQHNEYDLFVLFHDAEKAPSAHNGPSFIIWHRFYLLMFELAMQRYYKKCMMPYWDNRLLSRSGPNPRESIMFSSDLMGNAFGEVKTGFAAGFSTTESMSCQEISKNLSRAIPTDMEGLFHEDFTDFLKKASDYKQLCIPWDDTFETVHGLVHIFVGELMSYLACSPSDPLFYLHHSFVDYMYEKHFKQDLQIRYPNANISYPNIYEKTELDDEYAGDSIMMPFGILHDDMMGNNYFNPSYEVSPGDVQCWKDDDCCSNKNTEYVWCNRKTNKCAAKIQQGGRVKSGFSANACYCKKPKLPVIKDNLCDCE